MLGGTVLSSWCILFSESPHQPYRAGPLSRVDWLLCAVVTNTPTFQWFNIVKMFFSRAK